MESNRDEHDDDMDFASMPNFIPKDAPERKPDAPAAEESKPVSEFRKDLGDGAYALEWRAGGGYGELHREDGPASIIHYGDGTVEEKWYRHGKLHREDGPAISGTNATPDQWFIDGVRRKDLEEQHARDASAVPDVPTVPSLPIAAGVADVPEVPVTVMASTAQDSDPDIGAATDAQQDLTVDPAVMQALMATAASTAARTPAPAGHAALDPEAVLAQPAAAVHGAGSQAVQSGLKSLAEGGLSLVGGLAALAGSVGRGVGTAARGVAASVEARQQVGAPSVPRRAPGISVLPRISEYRVDQAEKMAGAYENAVEQFWASGNLPDVRRAIEEHAREAGVSVSDVMSKMVPGGELEGLRSRFVGAVGESDDAQANKKLMDRALESWVRQYGRGSEELLNPEPGQNPDYEAMRARFEGTREKMEKLVGQSPVFAGEDKSHAERFKEAVERIARRIQEMLERVADFIRGRGVPNAEKDVDYEP